MNGLLLRLRDSLSLIHGISSSVSVLHRFSTFASSRKTDCQERDLETRFVDGVGVTTRLLGF